jgi:hypothetical protein
MLHDHTSAMRNSPLNRLSQRPKVAPLLPRLLDARSPPGKVAIDPRFFTTRIEPMSLMDQASFARQSLAAIGATARDRNQDHDRYGSGPKAKRPRYDVRAPSAPLDVLASFVLKHHPRSLILRYNRFFTLRGWPLLAFSRLDRQSSNTGYGTNTQQHRLPLGWIWGRIRPVACGAFENVSVTKDLVARTILKLPSNRAGAARVLPALWKASQ